MFNVGNYKEVIWDVMSGFIGFSKVLLLIVKIFIFGVIMVVVVVVIGLFSVFKWIENGLRLFVKVFGFF